jgi:hypothetical protein
VIETPARGLDVRLRPGGFLGSLVEGERIDARQAGSGRQKDRQQEERLGPEQLQGHL